MQNLISGHALRTAGSSTTAKLTAPAALSSWGKATLWCFDMQKANKKRRVVGISGACLDLVAGGGSTAAGGEAHGLLMCCTKQPEKCHLIPSCGQCLCVRVSQCPPAGWLVLLMRQLTAAAAVDRHSLRCPCWHHYVLRAIKNDIRDIFEGFLRKANFMAARTTCQPARCRPNIQCALIPATCTATAWAQQHNSY